MSYGLSFIDILLIGILFTFQLKTSNQINQCRNILKKILLLHFISKIKEDTDLHISKFWPNTFTFNYSGFDK